MNMQNSQNPFNFNISLSILNHLGRNLYRNFITVLGEAISNAWDADAENVWIHVDEKNNFFVIKDDGTGMSGDDLQNKFLRIGYSKRKDDKSSLSKKGRPYIGRKGIGKLALLSCAKKISIISKQKNEEYVGGIIDNTELDKAITHDVNPPDYRLGNIEDISPKLESYKKGHEYGTIIYFEEFNDGIRNTLEYLKKLIALYFRFSLLDKNFSIYFNDEKITEKDLSELASKTQFAWMLNKHEDFFTSTFSLKKEKIEIENTNVSIKGFIASVEKPRDLTIQGMEERISIDLFVNGRLREKDILKHIPTARIVENYLYGQIHCDELDSDDTDRFTSNREGIVADDPKFKKILEILKSEVIQKIMEKWDELRRDRGQDGDSENITNLSKPERKAEELYNSVYREYTTDNKLINSQIKHKKFRKDATYNLESYAGCFIAENSIRSYIKEKIKEKKICLSPEAHKEAEKHKNNEKKSKETGNISIDIQKNGDDLRYLSMDYLANLVDKKDPIKEACLSRDAQEYKPIRNAIAHTALLTEEAKEKFKTTCQNIRSRLKKLFSEASTEE